MEFFATAAKGTEGVLRDELREIRVRGVRADRGGVHFAGDLLDAGRVCLWSRIAVRVLMRLSDFEARDERQLYDGVRAIDWSQSLSPRHTLAVSAVCKTSRLTHTQFVAQKTKDAIVDQLRDRLGARPSVSVEDADVRIFVHIVKDRATCYLDVSGESLHRRGWRARIGSAPLKETLAAACLRLVGWDGVRPFVDPMCGSGTIAIEAAQWARDMAPALGRTRFGFERWASHDETLSRGIHELREAARARAHRDGPVVIASDVDERVLSLARENARAAGVEIDFRLEPVSAIAKTDPPGLVLTNPPYGERLEGSLELYREMAQAFGRLSGHDVGILSGTPTLEDAMRTTAGRPDRWWALMNGPIECRLLLYRMR
jgi:23S rRNA G2445 N2-methylase RlmL